MDIERGLKQIIDKRVVRDQLNATDCVWVYFLRGADSVNAYKMVRSWQHGAHLTRIKRNMSCPEKDAILVKVLGGADCFVKVMRRIFKAKDISRARGGRDWFELTHDDISWLKSIPVCTSVGLESEYHTYLDSVAVCERGSRLSHSTEKVS